MAYILRIVQRYLPKDRAAFMALEAEFAAMEQRRPDFLRGRRLQPVTGQRPSNTLIWESEFPTLEEVQRAISKLSADAGHDALFDRQVPFITDAHMEIDEILEFPAIGR